MVLRPANGYLSLSERAQMAHAVMLRRVGTRVVAYVANGKAVYEMRRSSGPNKSVIGRT